MSDYSKTTNFTAKDALPTGNPSKVIKGSEHDTEFDNISTAVATKANKIASATNNNLVTMDATGDIKDSTIATNGTDTITANLTGNITGNLSGSTISDTNGNEVITLGETANAVNEITVTNAATGNAPSIQATGETNVDLELTRRGTGDITVDGIPIYGLVVLDTPEELLNTTSPATTATAINSTTLNTAGATKAIVHAYISKGSSGTYEDLSFYAASATFTANSIYRKAVAYTDSAAAIDTSTDSCEFTINLDSNNDFWYLVTHTLTDGTETIVLNLVGYYV